jgi:hypothetical protein
MELVGVHARRSGLAHRLPVAVDRRSEMLVSRATPHLRLVLIAFLAHRHAHRVRPTLGSTRDREPGSSMRLNDRVDYQHSDTDTPSRSEPA